MDTSCSSGDQQTKLGFNKTLVAARGSGLKNAADSSDDEQTSEAGGETLGPLVATRRSSLLLSVGYVRGCQAPRVPV